MARPQVVPPETAQETAPRADAPAAKEGGGAPGGVPMPLRLSELKAHHATQLVEMAVANGIENASRLRKQDLIFAVLKNQAKKGASIFGDGTLEVLPDGFGFLRFPETSYLASTDDIYVSPSQIRRFNLHTGDSIEGEIRTPKDGERYFALVKVDKVNGELPEAAKNKILFENLTPLHPEKAFKLERDIKAEENITGRAPTTPWCPPRARSSPAASTRMRCRSPSASSARRATSRKAARSPSSPPRSSTPAAAWTT